MAETIESPTGRGLARRSAWLAVALGVVAVVAGLARHDRPASPTLSPGWRPVGARAHDDALRERAWRAWAARDPSVALARTTTLFAADWPEGRRAVVLLGTRDDSGGVRVAVVLADGSRAERFSTRRLSPDARYFTAVVAAEGHTAVLVVAPDLTDVTVTTAAVGAARAEEQQARAAGGVLIPVPAGQTATRVVLSDGRGGVIADRVPGADEEPQTPPAPLILRESVVGGRRVQVRGDGHGLTCRVTLPDPATESPTLVECPA